MSLIMQAFELSKSNIGSGQYLQNGEPCCIIAHLYQLMGENSDDMKDWVDSDGDDLTIDQVISQGKGKILAPFLEEVSSLQEAFDNPNKMEWRTTEWTPEEFVLYRVKTRFGIWNDPDLMVQMRGNYPEVIRDAQVGVPVNGIELKGFIL